MPSAQAANYGVPDKRTGFPTLNTALASCSRRTGRLLDRFNGRRARHPDSLAAGFHLGSARCLRYPVPHVGAGQFVGIETIYIAIEPGQGGKAMERWLDKSLIRDRTRMVRLGQQKDHSSLYLD